MTDNEIIERFFRRDETALDAAQREYGRRCQALAKRILRNAEDAEECVNDGILRLWERIPPDRPASLGAYLSKIVRNLALDRLRERDSLKRGGRAVTVALDELQSVCDRDDAESFVTARELGRAVEAFLQTQPSRNANVFLRRYFYLEDRDEIAGRYGITVAQVSVILSRTRKKLRAYLKKEGLL